jgi:hypothetical protein
MVRKLTIDRRTGIATADNGAIIGRVVPASLNGPFFWRTPQADIRTDTLAAMAWELAGVYQCQTEIV